MAASPSHQWGQIIGGFLEEAVDALLRDFARRHGLYLDRKGARPARGKAKEVIWEDVRGNRHKLDYVMERGGTEALVGTPVAFIEIAWRRYTRHSKNKAQEIEGAIQPLLTKHREAAPFYGVVIGGFFTKPALEQLRSAGFGVLFFPYETIVSVFARGGIDASFDDETPDSAFDQKVSGWKALPESERAMLANALLELNAEDVRQFMAALELTASRQIESVRVLPLYGTSFEFTTIENAVRFVEGFRTEQARHPFAKHEIVVRFTNGNSIAATFFDNMSAIQSLRGYLPPAIHVVEDHVATDDAQ